MQWVEGDHLNSFVQKNLSQPKVIWELAQSFLKVLQELNRNSIAHGDLQHGNILVVGREIRLIDYDGMFVPAFKGMKSDEVGHRNYQHPYRGEKDFGAYMDNFSSLVIYLSLLAVSIDSGLWLRYSDGEENLLFRKADFTRPDNSPLLRELKNLRRSVIDSLCASLVSFALTTNLSQIPSLDFKRLQGIGFPGPDKPVPDWLSDYVLPGVKIKQAPSGGVHQEAFRNSHAKPASVVTGAEISFASRQPPFPVLLVTLAALVLLGVGLLVISSAVR
jgi:serine/threonine protein kinase